MASFWLCPHNYAPGAVAASVMPSPHESSPLSPSFWRPPPPLIWSFLSVLKLMVLPHVGRQQKEVVKWQIGMLCFNLLWQSCPGPQSKLSQQRRTLCQVIYPLPWLGDLFFPSQPWDWLNSSTLLMSRSSREFSHKICCCWKTWAHLNQNLFL